MSNDNKREIVMVAILFVGLSIPIFFDNHNRAAIFVVGMCAGALIALTDWPGAIARYRGLFKRR